MIVRYRKNHLLIWILLAIILGIAVVLSIWLRPEFPKSDPIGSATIYQEFKS